MADAALRSLSYSLRLQNDDFLPHTVNPNIPTALLDLPQDSLEGMAGITAINLSLVNRAIPRTTLTLRYRFFNHNEMTDELVFPGHVVNDQGLSNEPRQSSAFGYRSSFEEVSSELAVALHV